MIVCKSVEAASIEAVLAQVGYQNRIRGVITELDLSRWYAIACGKKYHSTLGKDLLSGILQEIALEFPLTQAKRVQQFFDERGYDVSKLQGNWTVNRNDIEVEPGTDE